MADKKNLPSTDDLKNRFKAGSIPLQSDFADLIDMAAAGASATGVASGQNGSPGLGMKLSADGKLGLNASTFNFSSDTDKTHSAQITVDSSNNKPVVDLAYGLVGSSDGLSVKASTGIVVNGSGVNVDPAIIANAEVGAKAAGKHSSQDGSPGLGMRLSSGGKLEINSDFYNYNYSSKEDESVFIAIDSGTNKPVVDLGNGLTSGDSEVEVSVKASTGIKVGTDGVSVDMAYVVPRGVIVMFSGNAVPAGWAFCNGQNGTPDLRDRFVKGANEITSVKTGGGSKTNTYHPTGTVTVDSHTLSIAEMPSHSHSLIRAYNGVYANGYHRPSQGLGGYEDIINGRTDDWLSKVGGNQGHSHTASFKGADYVQDNEPQHWILAFIMKL